MGYVVVVGGTTIDIQGFPKDELIYKDSNIGNVRISLGGVGRNIGENLARLGVDTRLISIIGDDVYGKQVVKSGEKIGLDMKDTLVVKGEKTSIYLSILNKLGDMDLAISSMDIYDMMDINFIEEKKDLIQGAKLCILDTNMPKEVIHHMVTKFHGVDFFLDTVSTGKTKKVKEVIGSFHTIKPNKLEAEILTGISIGDDEDLKRAAAILHEKGVKRVFITLGEEGVFYSDGLVVDHIKAPEVRVINATGAGDAFVAALAYGHMKKMPIDEMAKFSMYASVLAISHEDTINPNMSIKEIKLKMEEIR